MSCKKFFFISIIFITATFSENYKERREREKAQEFKAALAKTQGRRLSEVHIEEAAGLSKHGGLDEGSKLTPKGIFMVLQQVGVIAKSKDSDQADKSLKIEKGQTGTFSNQLFIVTVDPALLEKPKLGSTFVIKGLKSPEMKVTHARENTPQKELQNLAKVNEFIAPLLEKAGVRLSMAAGICWYTDMLNTKRYLAVLNVALGKSLKVWSQQYLEGKIDEAKWKKIMESTGKVLGLIHYTLATPQAQQDMQKGIVDWKTFLTTVHGDFHSENSYTDDVTGRTTPIDNGSMADSLNEKVSPLRDLADFYLKTKYMLHFNNPKGFAWLNEGFQSFDEEYASAFPLACQEVIKKEVMQKFHEWSKAVLDHVEHNGFASYSGHDVLSQIFPSMIAWFKWDKLSPESVVVILKTDPMTVQNKDHEDMAGHLLPLNP